MGSGPEVPVRPEGGYERIAALIAAGRCVVLDGATGTELPGRDPRFEQDERLWGTQALLDEPEAVRAVHRRYAEAGADVITTNTWGLASALLPGGPRLWDSSRPVHWMDVARAGLAAARGAAADAGRARECAVAFSLNGDVDAPGGAETIRLLARVWAEDPPDLLLLETVTLLRPSLDATLERLLATGLPVWLSFRRCRHGVCGVYGEHWGGPEGDGFGRAARRFEEMGVGALLVNCIPPDHVDGMVAYLRDFTDLPLGAYPNLGYLTNGGWRNEPGVGGEEYAAMALRWREEGAQIIGGCCGTGPEHIGALRSRLEGTRPGRRRPAPASGPNGVPAAAPAGDATWTDRRGRPLYPLAFPDLVCDPGVFVPSGASFLAWRHLAREGVGARQRCLDVGCGTGILTVQLALNGAAHVHAIDIEARAVANTLANAFRNDVAGRVTAAAEDLLPWVPEERYEVIVASLCQQPVDPFQPGAGHRRTDYWGRSLVDQLLAKLPDALAPEGVAYVVHLSILSRAATDRALAEAGLVAEVADVSVLPFPPELEESRTQVRRVEELSDAYHVELGAHDAVVAYLLEIRHRARRPAPARPPWREAP
jgi:S-methylmethionine-dependent homocysteine/selenocysteine methylase/SAM-dependent methyltransferase